MCPTSARRGLITETPNFVRATSMPESDGLSHGILILHQILPRIAGPQDVGRGICGATTLMEERLGRVRLFRFPNCSSACICRTLELTRATRLYRPDSASLKQKPFDCTILSAEDCYHFEPS